MDAEQKKNLINNAVKRIFGDAKPTADQEAFEKSKLIWKKVQRQIDPILRALPTPQAYDRVATMQLIMDMFRSEYNQWTADELVFIISLMHTEELIKQVDQIVHAGLIGPDKDKPI